MSSQIALSINDTPIPIPTDLQHLSGGIGTGSKIIQLGVTLLFIVAILLSLFYLIQGGIQFIVSGGDKQRIGQARLKLTYAVVGLIIILFAFFIVNSIVGFFNIKFF